MNKIRQYVLDRNWLLALLCTVCFIAVLVLSSVIMGFGVILGKLGFYWLGFFVSTIPLDALLFVLAFYFIRDYRKQR